MCVSKQDLHGGSQTSISNGSSLQNTSVLPFRLSVS